MTGTANAMHDTSRYWDKNRNLRTRIVYLRRVRTRCSSPVALTVSLILRQPHMVRTTLNSALPLSMRA